MRTMSDTAIAPRPPSLWSILSPWGSLLPVSIPFSDQATTCCGLFNLWPRVWRLSLLQCFPGSSVLWQVSAPFTVTECSRPSVSMGVHRSVCKPGVSHGKGTV